MLALEVKSRLLMIKLKALGKVLRRMAIVTTLLREFRAELIFVDIRVARGTEGIIGFEAGGDGHAGE